MRLQLPLLAPVLVLACEAPQARLETSDADGARVAVVERDADPASVVQLPAYPGARVQTRVGGAPADGGARGFVTVLETEDPVPRVIAFYDAAAREAGHTVATSVDRADRAVRIFSGTGPGSGTVLAVTRRAGEDRTRIVVTSGIADQALAQVRVQDALQAPRPGQSVPDRARAPASKPADVRLQ